MKPKNNLLHSLLISSVLSLMLCGSDIPKDRGTPIVFTSITPHAFFVRQIAEDRVLVRAFIGPGGDPHNFAPTPSMIADLSEANLYFRTGVEFENGLLSKIRETTVGTRIVDLRNNINLLPLSADQHSHNHHHHTEEHSHSRDTMDPHIWLSPIRAQIQARTILDALVEIDSAGAPEFRNNYENLVAELGRLDSEIREALRNLQSRELFVYHPSFGYFADDYNLHQIAVETGGKEPSARALARLMERARKLGARVIFVQPQYSPKAAQTLATQLDAVVVPLNPLPEKYFEEMRSLTDSIQYHLVSPGSDGKRSSEISREPPQ